MGLGQNSVLFLFWAWEKLISTLITKSAISIHEWPSHTHHRPSALSTRDCFKLIGVIFTVEISSIAKPCDIGVLQSGWPGCIASILTLDQTLFTARRWVFLVRDAANAKVPAWDLYLNPLFLHGVLGPKTSSH